MEKALAYDEQATVDEYEYAYVKRLPMESMD